jgi:hypothetical protein
VRVWYCTVERTMADVKYAERRAHQAPRKASPLMIQHTVTIQHRFFLE